MTHEDPNTQLALQRAQRRSERPPATPDDQLAHKLSQSLDIKMASATELLDMRKAIDAELVSRRERAEFERAQADKTLATLTRAGIQKPRATRKDKGTHRKPAEVFVGGRDLTSLGESRGAG